MNSRASLRRRHVRIITFAQGRGIKSVLLCALVFIAAGNVQAEDYEIVRVEEDWLLHVINPDESQSSPQVITSMSSTDELGDVHAVFELNHKTLPEFSEGGMALQLWSNDTHIDTRVSLKTGSLFLPDEMIYYTMRMELKNGNVYFQARNGYSTTWGSFGNYGYLTVGTTTTQSSLSRYDPDVSVANSQITFAKHRVKKFGILRVRYYTHDDQLIDVDYTDRMVHVLDESE